MSDYLRKTTRELRKLAADRRSGAAQISGQVLALVEEFCQNSQSEGPGLSRELAELAETTRRAHPSMGPLLNLANLLQLASDQETSSLKQLARDVGIFRRKQEQSTGRIARLLKARLPRRATVLTYSYSSTVVASLLASRRRIQRVYASEARPGGEGRALAEQLARAGIPITLVVDAALPGLVKHSDTIVVGADAITEKLFVNKIGTATLQRAARDARKPFFVLADRAKFIPSALAEFLEIQDEDSTIWKGKPRNVTIVNEIFERVPRDSRTRVLCEDGELRGPRLPAGLKREPVARHWKEKRSKGKR
jgi:translation initiation factor 2B subunit (eIF-2B alpha/beta/delta family)